MNNNEQQRHIIEELKGVLPVVLADMVEQYARCNKVERRQRRRLKRCLKMIKKYAWIYEDSEDEEDQIVSARQIAGHERYERRRRRMGNI